MRDKLKKIISRVFLPVFISIVMGAICGHIIYNIYIDKNDVVFSSNIVYVLQTGAFSNYNNMRANSLSNNYVYYEDNGLFKTIIGITHDEDNIAKIKSVYNTDIVVSKYLINDFNLYNKIVEFDNKIKNENNKDIINELMQSMLKKYQDFKNIELVKVEKEDIN